MKRACETSKDKAELCSEMLRLGVSRNQSFNHTRCYIATVSSVIYSNYIIIYSFTRPADVYTFCTGGLQFDIGVH